MNTPHAHSKRIIREVASARRVALSDVLGRDRTMNVCDARREAIWRLRQEKKLSQTQLGRIFGRCHTTICYALQQAKAGVRSYEGSRGD